MFDENNKRLGPNYQPELNKQEPRLTKINGAQEAPFFQPQQRPSVDDDVEPESSEDSVRDDEIVKNPFGEQQKKDQVFSPRNLQQEKLDRSMLKRSMSVDSLNESPPTVEFRQNFQRSDGQTSHYKQVNEALSNFLSIKEYSKKYDTGVINTVKNEIKSLDKKEVALGFIPFVGHAAAAHYTFAKLEEAIEMLRENLNTQTNPFLKTTLEDEIKNITSEQGRVIVAGYVKAGIVIIFPPAKLLVGSASLVQKGADYAKRKVFSKLAHDEMNTCLKKLGKMEIYQKHPTIGGYGPDIKDLTENIEKANKLARSISVNNKKIINNNKDIRKALRSKKEINVFNSIIEKNKVVAKNILNNKNPIVVRKNKCCLF